MAVETRPQPVSRDTRRLLLAAGIAVLCLWALARLRFPETPVAANPVPPLLAQLAPPTRFAELAAEVRTLTSSLDPLLARVQLVGDDGQAWRVALRVRPGVAAAVVPIAHTDRLPVAAEARAVDRPSGLLLVNTSDEPHQALRPAVQIDPLTGHYLFAAAASGSALNVRPVFVPRMQPEWSHAWRADGWRLDQPTSLRVGEFLFTANGECVGVVTAGADGALVVVPASPLAAAVGQLLGAMPGQGTGWLGVTAGPLTPALQRVTGAARGVLVTHVDANAPATNRLSPGEVIDSVDGEGIESIADWQVIAERLRPGETHTVRVVHRGGDRDVTLTAVEPPPDPATPLGLRLRMTRAGLEVLEVDPDTTAARTLRPGDVITQVNDLRRPTVQRFLQALRSSENGVLILFTRRGVSQAAALEP